MRHTLKLILTLIILTTAFSSEAGIGLGDWSCTTPGRNQINNFSGRSLYLQNGKQIDGLSNWFFYHSCIIGQYGDNKYFVANEHTYQIDTFLTKQEWSNFLNKQHLNPKMWTRWHDTNWKSPYDDLRYYMFMTFYISVPLIILNMWLFYNAIRREKLNIKKPNTIIMTLLTVIILIDFLLGQVPQSI